MDRRDFLRMATTASLLGAVPCLATSPAVSAWRRYELIYEVDLSHLQGAGQLWLPVVQPVAAYQRVESVDWSGGGESRLYSDTIYNAPMVVSQWRAQDKHRRVQVCMRVATQDNHGWQVGQEQQKTVDLYLKPTRSMPLDGIVKQTAELITKDIQQPLARARAIYEWIVDNTFRDPATEACGLGDIKSMLETGHLGGKCADINSLFVGLARAAGIPARECYGVRVDQSQQFSSLGAQGDISRAQHCRAEFFSSEYGWVPVDPADVRKVVLQEKLPLTDARVAALRERLFGYWEMNWVAFNTARDFVLPGATVDTEVPFLMYPYARFGEQRLNGHRPAQFIYRLSSRRLA